MAFDAGSPFAGWEHWAGRAKAAFKVTSFSGDATTGDANNDVQGVAWAEAVATVSVPQVLSNTPVVSTSAYVAGNVLGGAIALTVPNTGLIQNAAAQMKSGAYVGQIDLLLFSALPASGVADHAAVAIPVAAMPTLLGVLHLTDGTLVGAATAIVQTLEAAFAYALPPGQTTMYVVPVVQGTPTFGAAGDVQVSLTVLR